MPYHRIAILFSSLCMLYACTSSTAPLKYYLLHQPTDVTASTSPVKHTVQIKRVTVSDYLLQRGLAMQTTANALHVSTTHLWAEPFESGFKKLLTHALAPEVNVPIKTLRNETTLELRVNLLHLIATNNGEVIINADYSLIDQNDVIAQQKFYASYTLQANGYTNAVALYRKAIFDLAEHIKQELVAL